MIKPDHLIIRYLSNEATAAEQEQLFEWVSQSPANQKVFNDYIRVWKSERKPDSRFNMENGLQLLNSRIDAFEETEKKKRAFWNVWNVAAAVLLLTISGFTLYQYGIFAHEDHVKSLLSEKTAGDAVMAVTLTDGSLVTLNERATLKYPSSFQGGTREVYLTGEAFFNVTKDPLKPFVIHANGTTTTVLGTSFNINASVDSVVISVATGRVQVSDGKRVELLRPYEKVSVTGNTFYKTQSDLSELNWNPRVLEFNDLSLARAAELIAAYYEMPVAFQNEKIKTCTITGKFRNQKLQTILDAIEFSTDVQSKIENNTIVFFGKGCH